MEEGGEIASSYNPQEVEGRIYALWEESGFFNPDKLPAFAKVTAGKLEERKENFVVMMPPPNITGSLHMGHALEAALTDCLVRMKRMQGFRTLWLPGTDHASIATHYVVEKELKKEGLTRHDLGREKFLERVWAWREKYGSLILGQFKRIGVSADWSRAVFTMDPSYMKAVETAFHHYEKKGWIYKGERVVSWCPRCATSLSDLELEYKEERGKLWYIRYPLTNGKSHIAYGKSSSDKRLANSNKPYIVVATTRPETMLGDTAVAVHPDDERYRNLVGAVAVLPLVGRELRVVADTAVEKEFGTGAVKVTPAHDLVDAEIGERHALERIKVIGEDGRVTREAPEKYRGMTVKEARAQVVEDLKAQGFVEKEEDYAHNVAHCYRCATTIEPLPSPQWFLKMEVLAQHALYAYTSGRVRILPERFSQVAIDWLRGVRDWPISRQLWWGQKIPVWYCGDRTRFGGKKMGFHETVVPQVYQGKSKTYRLRDHGFAVGDRVAFENSQTGQIFGYGTIIDVVRTTVGEIDIADQTHFATYRTHEDLIAAFKRHFPIRTITNNTPAFLYAYEFMPLEPGPDGCGASIVSAEKPARCPHCNAKKLVRDPDVFDTWFSSALWPFATLGWPSACAAQTDADNTRTGADKNEICMPQKGTDLEKYYPTQWMTSAREILHLWITRMVFSGIELAGAPPFADVWIHPTVLTTEGRRMSKSLGTGIDPLELIERYGADATRFGLLWHVTGLQDIRFDETAIVSGKKFCNKLWNATRFVLNYADHTEVPDALPHSLNEEDQALLRQLRETQRTVEENIAALRFGQAIEALYAFFWHAFCDKFIEQAKKRSDHEVKHVLLWTLATSLKLLHPFIPFITEEIWQKFPLPVTSSAEKSARHRALLMVEQWPS